MIFVPPFLRQPTGATVFQEGARILYSQIGMLLQSKSVPRVTPEREIDHLHKRIPFFGSPVVGRLAALRANERLERSFTCAAFGHFERQVQFVSC
jgi:hypothetical protein